MLSKIGTKSVTFVPKNLANRSKLPIKLATKFLYTTTTTQTETLNKPTNVNEMHVKTTTLTSSLSEIPISPELEKLVDSICRLDLIQTSQVIGLIKKRLNLPDIVAAPSILSAQSIAPGGPSATDASAAAAANTPAKSEFKIILEKFDPANKAKVIKEIKTILPQLNLVEAKSFVESAPKMIKEKVKKEDAEKIKKTLEDLGATITLD